MARNAIYPPSVKPGIPREWELPAGWAWTPLSNVIEVVERPAALNDDVEYQLVTAKRNRGGIVARERLKGRDILTKSQFFVKAGDFVISRRQIIHGACGVAPESLDGAVVSNEYSTLRTKGALQPAYLRLLSHTPYFQMTCFQSSVGVDVEKMVFKLDDWLRFRVPLPPLDEQRRIAAVLQAADDAVDAAEAVIDQTEKVKRGLVEQLLTRGMPGRHTRFKMSEIGEVPESWDLVRIADVARLESGHTPSRSHDEYWNGGIPWISLHDTKRLTEPVLFETEQTISEVGLANSSARLLPAGTVAFSRTATVGLCTVMGREMATSQDFANYVCGPAVLNRYLMHNLRSRQAEWNSLKSGSTHKTIYMPDFERLRILLPPRHEQEEIVGVIEAFDGAQKAARNTGTGARTTRAGLAAELLAGRVRVPA